MQVVQVGLIRSIPPDNIDIQTIIDISYFIKKKSIQAVKIIQGRLFKLILDKDLCEYSIVLFAQKQIDAVD